MKLLLARSARDRYQMEEAFFAPDGHLDLPTFHQVRLLVQKLNARRDLLRFPEQAVQAGQVNAMGLIVEILEDLLGLYGEQRNAAFLEEALGDLEEALGKAAVEEMLLRFLDAFPPPAVYAGRQSPQEYLVGETAGRPHRQEALKRLLTLWLINVNPAFSPWKELFDDAPLSKTTAYRAAVERLHTFFERQPPFGPDRQNLLEMLRSPAIAVPHSLPGQLAYMQERWGYLLGRYLYLLLRGLDLLREEEARLPGPGPARVLEFVGLELEPERFSPDRDWMPQLVLMAKNTYVWLDQLSKKYGREVHRLDQIPDEELDLLARRGFSGLWLIGLWERSPASRRIKQLCGNPEAVSSAYSLMAYRIADDLGGEEALRNLRQRAWLRGIRLASDMVPNHMGIDSIWVMEHPEWFISLEQSPFPAYTFNGPDLSWNPEVGIFLEDHYYNRSDAAVVFMRVDRRSGQVRYIYHGNDGTSMPWNDTAQLNYLLPEVREQVIQTILEVARRFPIIRFDAAMTLTKRHYQRLWFPEPGSGGAIPSRAEYGMTREAFNRALPEEFWRQVVDRVAAEMPDLLLLAEAFWLMEGYFVRTLGMHRVYNSAFMNMLRDEKNAEYRLVLKNTLEFDPEVLKRFVNFMNNPDEETAVAQFGKGDKYFGICTLMATMPGLPMFGHGQIEGFAEKYGMEYRRAYWEEQPDPGLVERHERAIFPLLHRRHLFADVQHFFLYDLFTPEGQVNEDVLAYSNRVGRERALVLYHNRYAEARGWIRTSVAFLDKATRQLVQRTLAEGLDLRGDPGLFYLFRDHVGGRQYIRRGSDLCERGLYVELGAYEHHVFLDWREVWDPDGRYTRLERYLNGRGVPDIEEALQEVLLQPVLAPLWEVVNAGLWGRLREAALSAAPPPAGLLDEVERRCADLAAAVAGFVGLADAGPRIAQVVGATRRALGALLHLPAWLRREAAVGGRPAAYRDALCFLQAGLDDSPATWGPLLAWALLHPLGAIADPADPAARTRSWIEEWRLGRPLAEALRGLGADEAAIPDLVTLVRLLTAHSRWFERGLAEPPPAARLLGDLLRDDDLRRFLRVHRYGGVLWFHRESWAQVCHRLLLIAGIEAGLGGGRPAPPEAAGQIEALFALVRCWQAAAGAAGYRLDDLLPALGEVCTSLDPGV